MSTDPESKHAGQNLRPDPPSNAEVVERMRLQLIRSEQLAAIGRMVAGLAHEINNPLSGILCSIQLMKEIVAGGGEATAAAAEANRNELNGLLHDCGTMVDRIRELMTAVRGMSRDRSKDDAAFDPARAIRDAARVFAIARRHRCRVDLSLQALPAVKGSPSRLGQVLLNLLENGVDASSPGALLSIAAESSGSLVRITVTDQGTGIPANIAGQVFEPFFSSKTVDQGTGLGLYISREIVTAMGGTIGFETSPTGTTFRVELPAYLPARDL